LPRIVVQLSEAMGSAADNARAQGGQDEKSRCDCCNHHVVLMAIVHDLDDIGGNHGVILFQEPVSLSLFLSLSLYVYMYIYIYVDVYLQKVIPNYMYN
jgi:hypothetical protein